MSKVYPSKILVLGAGGFIGGHLVNRLRQEGHAVVGVDIKPQPYDFEFTADSFLMGDLADAHFMKSVIDTGPFSEIYQLAADMGGAGYIFTGQNDANVMTNSAAINLNLLRCLVQAGQTGPQSPRIFYSSSACIYPQEIQTDPKNVDLKEDAAYPANPDSEYGWEKLFSERLFFSYARNYGLDVHVARYHNVYGIKGTWRGGKEKAPAAICRKVAEASEQNDFNVEVWGDGLQTRSFLYIEDCVDATIAFTRSNFSGPLNIGSEEMVSINELVDLVADLASKKIVVNHIPGPLGVQGRTSNNDLIKDVLSWSPRYSLQAGMKLTYEFVSEQVAQTP